MTPNSPYVVALGSQIFAPPWNNRISLAFTKVVEIWKVTFKTKWKPFLFKINFLLFNEKTNMKTFDIFTQKL